jgi:hypothetical protein
MRQATMAQFIAIPKPLTQDEPIPGSDDLENVE